MKHTILFLCLIFLASCKEAAKDTDLQVVEPVKEQQSEVAEPVDKKSLSPHASAMVMIGEANIQIDYSSPGVRERIVFGGLLPYDQVWQAGAHMATWIETNKDLVIEEQTLPAGKYGFFTIPSKDEWTIIFNSNWNQHGKDDYDEKDDVLRLTVKPVISENITEHLEYKVSKLSKNEGTIALAWEKVNISFPFKVNK